MAAVGHKPAGTPAGKPAEVGTAGQGAPLVDGPLELAAFAKPAEERLVAVAAVRQLETMPARIAAPESQDNSRCYRERSA